MQNKIEDLNNHLFAQLERLNDEDLTGEQLEEEIRRAKAIASISSQIIDTADITLRAVEIMAEAGEEVSVPQFIECTTATQKKKRIG